MSPKLRAVPQRTEIAKRLEHIRKSRGHKTLKAFWKVLTAGGDYEISYEAVRNYHFDREPPPSYLAQVAKVFHARLDWLILGKGEPFVWEHHVKLVQEQVESRNWPAVLRTLFEKTPSLQELRPHVISAFVDTWGRYQMLDELGVVQGTSDNFQLEFGEALVQHLLSVPFFDQNGILPEASSQEFSDYAVLMLYAINLGLEAWSIANMRESSNGAVRV